jgi:hypothetical protein
LQNTAGFLGHARQPLSFVDRERQGLFAIHILARAHGRSGDQGMPVIDGAAEHDIDVPPLEDTAKVLRRLGLRPAFFGGRKLRIVDIAQRHDPAERLSPFGDASASSAASHQRHRRLVAI